MNNSIQESIFSIKEKTLDRWRSDMHILRSRGTAFITINGGFLTFLLYTIFESTQQSNYFFIIPLVPLIISIIFLFKLLFPFKVSLFDFETDLDNLDKVDKDKFYEYLIKNYEISIKTYKVAYSEGIEIFKKSIIISAFGFGMSFIFIILHPVFVLISAYF